ncbi:TetR/AcrR family transcriptional regulator [Stappia taiwanensis]|nr:TetR/AcrR family transcriptional regulator [Stappia taiwanensis]
MKDVADRVGLLKSSLYSHFPNKEALIPHVLALTQDEIFRAVEASGDWRADFEAFLTRLGEFLTASRRCIGLHLAYGLNECDRSLEPVRAFFDSLRDHLARLLKQGLDEEIAEDFALDTLTLLEGATLWLALKSDSGPMQAACAALRKRADGLALDVEASEARALLDGMVGDWRLASAVEKQLAMRLAETEADLLSVRAALAGQIEAESCFR